MKHSQIAVGDVELHVVELGTGQPVLFCHGFPDVWIGWRKQMEAVAAAGYRAIASGARSIVERIELPTLPAQTGFLHEICKSAYSRREFTSAGIDQAHRKGGKRPVGKELSQPA